MRFREPIASNRLSVVAVAVVRDDDEHERLVALAASFAVASSVDELRSVAAASFEADTVAAL